MYFRIISDMGRERPTFRSLWHFASRTNSSPLAMSTSSLLTHLPSPGLSPQVNISRNSTEYAPLTDSMLLLFWQDRSIAAKRDPISQSVKT